ncbi:hypothetical protein TWF694_010449 [Orbilia ellipsospora]|uniref:VWFA domain-containing protein n=1 Tax=Orbilia ellipsospora TaxID=2528407 RepID=A0AAV9X9Y6_9PEZI
MSPPKGSRSKGKIDLEQLMADFRKVLRVKNFGEFITKHLSSHKDLQKLEKLRDGWTDEEYREMIENLAGKMTDKIAGKFQKSFSEAVDIVEKEERDVVKQRKEAASQPQAPAAAPAPPTGTTPETKSVPETDSLKSAQDSIFDKNSGSNQSSNTSDIDSLLTQHELPPREELEAEYIAYAEEFIEANFKGLLNDKSGVDVKQTMMRAAEKAKEIMRKYDLDPKDVKKLTKLALYDFAILCDDSWSMNKFGNWEGEDRVSPLKVTLGKITNLATLIEPAGISVRFINYTLDCLGDWDHITSTTVLSQKLGTIEWEGRTDIGTALNNKIIQPMVIQKMQKGEFKKPLIVVAITDGDPTDGSMFRDTIRDCKSSKVVTGYGEATVVFVVSRVGSDAAAKDFLNGLKKSKDLKDWVYCSANQLDDNAAVMKQASIAGEAQGDKEYAKKILQIFLEALDQQTK